MTSAAQGFPLLLDLTGRRVLVVGGGSVGSRRAEALARAGARVHVVAPVVDPRLVVSVDEWETEQVSLREFEPGDVHGCWLVVAATSSPVINELVAATAEAAGVWCVRSDDAEASRAWVPAVARSGALVVSVNAGGDPRRAVALRDEVLRQLDSGELPVRPTRRADGIGRVSLVGGGPGDPGLITVRGRRLLAEADAVVVDKLAPRALLETLAPEVAVIDAGKSPHSHNMTQDEINAEIVRRALSGEHVVRLKGGDPFVFGRGGEEALACVAAGVPFEVVPGVTSAIAVPALAGIPVTHRGLTQDVSVVSAHLDPAAAGSTVDWSAMARLSGTLVLLMAVDRLPAITAALREHGRPGSTPVAVVQDGSTDRERVVVGTLDDIAERCTAEGIRPPAVVVVGEVVSLRKTLRWR